MSALRQRAAALQKKLRRAARKRLGEIDAEIGRLAGEAHRLREEFGLASGAASERSPLVLATRRATPETVTLREVEREHIGAVLRRCNGNQTVAAIRLGIGRNTLRRKMKLFGFDRRLDEAA